MTSSHQRVTDQTTIVIHNAAASLIGALADEIRSSLATPPADPLGRSHDFAVMLAGGTTPLAAYADVTGHPIDAASRAHAFLSDDRHVPTDSPDSNYAKIHSMLEACGITDGRDLRIPTEFTLEKAVSFFESELKAFLERRGTIPMGILGLGQDGHTASIFTEHDLERAAKRLAVGVGRPDGLQGVSVTPTLLKRVKRLIFVVSGESKQDILARFVSAPQTTMAGKATMNCPHVEIWCDEAAAAKLE